ncbi:hypothetical protein KL930_000604 [Ogataea haglerorum]|uniref:AB hydrolase-1 domain-containing protein n=1 Tax=Ogataea haglerorum TaxID=1937702 RepID=A0ABQ7R9Z5_9ASCO|nr:uncharacterized protein KL911_005303 [Ogataea haglerorum]KAG7699917.1 hypothetical protein KL915_000606 [Ogataea haglerorum]KAG7701575.1 hypothetical protein KL951_000031 [Ogataea haglerorum]KAG7711389.1 hypothetical protein KL914_000031 [Ogataea haglerorum]KAG7712160.1 hypothetical protein KL950_000031 [Ogataea haglerorum]KAG7722211.1 hypothetical protein KL913_000031 [Ogataea haglerorum]
MRGIVKKTFTPGKGEWKLAYDFFCPTSTGTIPPLVLLHGLLGNRKQNRHVAGILAHNLQTPVLVPDLTNHGDSFHRSAHSNELMSEDISNLLKTPAINPQYSRGYVMIGHSMGGKAAMFHALNHPNDVLGVASVDNVPYKNPRAADSEFARFDRFFSYVKQFLTNSTFSSLAEVDQKLKDIEPDKRFRQLLASNFKRNKVSKAIECKVPVDVLQQSLETLKILEVDGSLKYNGPLLIIRALKSPFVGEIDHEKVSDHFPNYSTSDINTGHWVITEDCPGFVTIIDEWIKNQKFGNHQQ